MRQGLPEIESHDVPSGEGGPPALGEQGQKRPEGDIPASQFSQFPFALNTP